MWNVDFQSGDLPGAPGSSFLCSEQAGPLEGVGGGGRGDASGEGGKALQGHTMPRHLLGAAGVTAGLSQAPARRKGFLPTLKTPRDIQ